MDDLIILPIIIFIWIAQFIAHKKKITAQKSKNVTQSKQSSVKSYKSNTKTL